LKQKYRQLILIFFAFGMFCVVLGEGSAAETLFVNPDTSTVLHSPSIDIHGTILFGQSQRKSGGWFLGKTQWYLLDTLQTIRALPIQSTHAFLAASGRHVVFSSPDGLVYLYDVEADDSLLVSSPRHMLDDGFAEELVNPIVSPNLQYIYSRATYYEFYYEDVALFHRTRRGDYPRHPLSAEYLLACDAAYFTKDNQYLVTCGEAFGAERPTGLTLFDLEADSVVLHTTRPDYMDCVFQADDRSFIGVTRSYDWDDSYEWTYCVKKYALDAGTVTDSMVLSDQLQIQAWHHQRPLLAYVTDTDVLKVMNYAQRSTTTLATVQDPSFLAWWPRMVWDLNTGELIMTTDTAVKRYASQ